MDFQNRVEILIISLIGAICVIIPILDFVNALDSMPWLSQRISTMTLLAVGAIALYFVSQHQKRMNEFSSALRENTNQILAKLTVDETNQKILDVINDIWKEREADFEDLFKKVAEIPASNGNEALKTFLRKCENDFDNGIVFGAKLWQPWDINIIAVDLSGKVLYHSHEPSISTRYPKSHPTSQILERRNGVIFWINDLKGKLAFSVAPSDIHFGKNLRFTQIYFREIPQLRVIVIVQSHINIIPFIGRKYLAEKGKNTTN